MVGPAMRAKTATRYLRGSAGSALGSEIGAQQVGSAVLPIRLCSGSPVILLDGRVWNTYTATGLYFDCGQIDGVS